MRTIQEKILLLYTVTDDDGGVSNVATVNLTITDVNDAPVDLILSNTFIHESEPIGTVVGTFTTVDLDPNETFTYSLVGWVMVARITVRSLLMGTS